MNRFAKEPDELLLLEEKPDDRSVKDIMGIAVLARGYGGGGDTRGGIDKSCGDRQKFRQDEEGVEFAFETKNRDGSVLCVRTSLVDGDDLVERGDRG